MPELSKEEQKIKNTIRFIEAAQELIDETGVENVSIRKIAERAGFHNSTIYLYFKDVNHLIQLASMRHFEEYSRSLAELSARDASPKENFTMIWTYFCQTVFKNPNLFYHFFFGKYSDNLTPIMKQYYDLFPDKKYTFSEDIEEMFFGKNIQERCLKLLIPLIGTEGVRVTYDNLEIVNNIMVGYLKDVLDQKRQNQEMSSEELTDQTLEALQYIVGY